MKLKVIVLLALVGAIVVGCAPSAEADQTAQSNSAAPGEKPTRGEK